ncbi:MAG TPA: hypothetical protein VIL38_03130, partial [Thermaerobacter sp.]
MPPTRWNRPPARWNRPPARRPWPRWRPALSLVLAIAAILGTTAPPPAYGTHRPPAVEPAPAEAGDPTGRPAATGGPPLSGGVPDRTLTLLLANVGNSNAHCQPYAFKLCFRRVEARIARAIQQLRPDLIGLIEVWPDDRCATLYGGTPEPDPQKVCWRNPLRAAGSSGSGRPAFQVQRLVGPGYQIACDARFGWDCVAARDGRVRLAAVSRPGGFVLHGLETAPPVPGCDPGFTVNAVTVTRSPVGRFRLILAHPDSGVADPAQGARCREAQIRQALELAGLAEPAPGDGPAGRRAEGHRRPAVLWMGDMNLDPWRQSGPDVDLWHRWVGPDRPLRYHSGIAEHDPPYITHHAGESSNLLPTGRRLPTVEEPAGAFPRRTLDHVTSTFLAGTCRTLGEAPGTRRLDGGPGGGMDHRALWCTLTLPKAAASPPAPAGSGSPGGGSTAAAPGPSPGHVAGDDARPAATGDLEVRVVAVGYKHRLEHAESYEDYYAHMRALMEQARPHLRRDRPNLVVFPEETALVTAFIGPRGAAARARSTTTEAFAALAAAYAPQIAYYRARFPGVPPLRLLFLALTDTQWRAFFETFSRLAREYGVYLSANVNAPEVRPVTDPARAALLGDPLRPRGSPAYEAVSPELWNVAVLFGPDGRIVARQKKVYLVPAERAEMGLNLSAEGADRFRVIPTALGPLAFMTSKDAWMVDLVDRADLYGAALVIQPEAYDRWATRPAWEPDGFKAGGWAAVQRYPALRYNVTASLTGNFFELPFDGQSAVLADGPLTRRRWGWIGQPADHGYLAVAPWVVADPVGWPLDRRRAYLAAVGDRLQPGSGDALENGYVESVIAADVTIPGPWPLPATPAGPDRRDAPGPDRSRSSGAGPAFAPAFAPPVRVDGGPDPVTRWRPALAYDAATRTLYAVWVDFRRGAQNVWLARSRDGGRTWEAAAPVYAPPPDPHQFDNRWAPAVAAGGGRVAVAWVDFRDESWDVYLAVSRDGGRTFSPPRRVDDARGPYERLHTDPVLALLPPGSPQAGPPALAAAWTDLRDRRPDTDVRWAVSRDGGSTWDAQGPVHPADPSPVEAGTVAPANQWAPSLAVDRRGRLWVAWQQLDKGTGRNRVMVRRLGSRGWGGEGDDPGPPLAVNPSHGGNQWRPRLAAGPDGRLAVVWEEDGTG